MVPQLLSHPEKMSSKPGSRTIVEQLTTPGFFGPGDPVLQVVETHISWVFLTQRFAYKLKKPVRFGFLDFSTAELRHRACLAELQANRRFAQQVYLQVVPLTQLLDDPTIAPLNTTLSSRVTGRDFSRDRNFSRDGGGSERVGELKLPLHTTTAVELDGEGPPVDWLVKMQRLPAERALDVLLQHGKLTSSLQQRLITFISSIYSHQAPLYVRPDQYLANLRQHIQQNEADLLRTNPHASAVVRRISAAQLLFTWLASDTLAWRVVDGRVIDGHGDLRPEHIYLTTPPVIIDCIEFDPQLRHNDAADELAFLAMECDQLRAGHLGQLLLEDYMQRSGDRVPAGVFAFFKAYRACVRAKVASLRAAQRTNGPPSTTSISSTERSRPPETPGAPGYGESPELPAETAPAAASTLPVSTLAAPDYLEAAESYVRSFVRNVVLVVSGLSGTGKTTLASALADRLGCRHISTDDVRQQMNSVIDRPQSSHADDYGAGAYTTPERLRTYDQVIAQAGEALREHVAVVVDGTFNTPTMQHTLTPLLRDQAAEILWVRCYCPAEVAQQRVVDRLAHHPSSSEARPEWLVRQAAEFVAPSFPHQLNVDTMQPIEDQVLHVIDQLRTIQLFH